MTAFGAAPLQCHHFARDQSWRMGETCGMMLAYPVTFLGLLLTVLPSCASDSETNPTNAGGSSQGLAGGVATTAAGTTAKLGGTTGHVGGSPTTSGGSSQGGATTTQAAGSTSLGKSCNPARVTCDMMTPKCPAMQAPELSEAGDCYTHRCIPIGDCTCNVPTDCPDTNQYTCRNDLKRCTPYLY